LAAALAVGWVCLLRSGEYLAADSGKVDAEKVVRREDVRFFAAGARVALGARVAMNARGAVPDEVAILVRKSKTDQRGQGVWLHTGGLSSSQSALCIVRRLWALMADKGGGVDAPLFWLPVQGRALRRHEVADALQRAAVALRLDEVARYTTHSLRRGGASAMWAAGVSVEEIRRRGRWASNCWRRYVAGDRAGGSGLAAAMAAAVVRRPGGGGGERQG
jgi:hypothetical protein